MFIVFFQKVEVPGLYVKAIHKFFLRSNLQIEAIKQGDIAPRTSSTIEDKTGPYSLATIIGSRAKTRESRLRHLPQPIYRVQFKAKTFVRPAINTAAAQDCASAMHAYESTRQPRDSAAPHRQDSLSLTQHKLCHTTP
jgi:hypothetical protein